MQEAQNGWWAVHRGGNLIPRGYFRAAFFARRSNSPPALTLLNLLALPSCLRSHVDVDAGLPRRSLGATIGAAPDTVPPC
jgi:hypothetical protein